MKKGFRQKAILEFLLEAKRPLQYGEIFQNLGASAAAKKEIRLRIKRLMEQNLVKQDKNGCIQAVQNETVKTPKIPKEVPPIDTEESREEGVKTGRVSFRQGRLEVLIKVRGTQKPFPLLAKGNSHIRDGDLVVVKPVLGKNKFYTIVAKTGENLSFEQVVREFYRELNIKDKYPKPGLEEVAHFSEEVEINSKFRQDLTSQRVITIDPKGARDHDDAIFVEVNENDYTLYVHIADVSEYVSFGSKLDQISSKRAFTQYFPWEAIPMLPEKLANGLCSLKEGIAKNALTCVMKISKAGMIKDYHFQESFIRVHKYYTYEEAFEAYQKENSPEIKNLAMVAEALQQKRAKDGIMNFNFPEPRFDQDEVGAPVKMTPRDDLPSNHWIEECMLAANTCTAKYLKKNKLPGMYRIHEPPDFGELEAVSQMISLVEVHLEKPLPASLKKIPKSEVELRSLYNALINLTGLEDHPAVKQLLQTKLLRSMKKALYHLKPIGHFALGWEDYTHYTSPIRRYPDLWNHRLIKKTIKREKVPASWKSIASSICEQVNEREIEVMKLERKSHKCAMAWIMRDMVGEVFKAHVASIDAKGLAVFIKNELVFGEIWNPLSRFRDDFYEYDENAEVLVGKRTGRKIKINDEFKVRIERVDPVRSQIDFEMLS